MGMNDDNTFVWHVRSWSNHDTVVGAKQMRYWPSNGLGELVSQFITPAPVFTVLSSVV